MKLSSLGEVYSIAQMSKEDLELLARKNNKPIQVILHWSAGYYDSLFEDYHINITGDGKIYITTDNFATILSHNYYKNSASIGVCLCCGYDLTPTKCGDVRPTAVQIETMAKVIAQLSKALDIPIDIHHVCTHGESADNEDYNAYIPGGKYGPKTTCERWDLECLWYAESQRFNPNSTNHDRGGDVLRGKAIWYYNH